MRRLLAGLLIGVPIGLMVIAVLIVNPWGAILGVAAGVSIIAGMELWFMRTAP